MPTNTRTLDSFLLVDMIPWNTARFIFPLNLCTCFIIWILSVGRVQATPVSRREKFSQCISDLLVLLVSVVERLLCPVPIVDRESLAQLKVIHQS